MQHFVTISGNIGAGKTNLSKILSEKLNWSLAPEPVDENPYLKNFYQDMKKWAFHSQVFYLSKMVEYHHSLSKREVSSIQDRSVYENAEIFAKNLYNQGQMSFDEWETYQLLYKSLLLRANPPDLLIYLKATPEFLMERIQERSREAERNISFQYIQQLNTLYNDWIINFTLCPILILDLAGTDFKNRPKEQDEIVEKMFSVIKNS
ncbi:hypothetical protein A2223_02375 [Candidatus Falkowbacteria bacterium RIFOXYA2_FULL_35_8]|uniref:Deoxynucleoside kinase domain-containing protein n=1 Tax=Candidatus Falkowbacteria bacterium RIFOXYC2_FULL_36_12 TaxID=1798002 RepID=A0A1F5T3E2_9BACT|nr:MAG: hypothetical protein A2300_02890 [Candidatus Falkowbacteria bacterium RIFOXYB2_FULL_35_7]OGF33429.1 MAG: hypothetical protein A2478_01905 [Candidatus Falkowbacteria bacterium RIFOXYC2_FULL_36_12]OGF33924.1 MAG: hypothetical protein A2223_02375 [Candidatus Falkowbacteria bacterium RIFOXYA2_FULL_35_8]